MRRHTQTTGTRKWFGNHLTELQSEGISVLDGFFGEYGCFVISGCEISEVDRDMYDVSPGIVAVEDLAGNVYVARFDGARDVLKTNTLYVYFAQESILGAYVNGGNKEIINHIYAASAIIEPDTLSYIEFAWGSEPVRFRDAIQSSVYRFVTDAEKTTWNNKAGTAVATTSSNGLMSSTDKTKLNGIATNANNYVHPTQHAPAIIAQDSNNRFVTDAEKTTWNNKASTAVATTSSNGLMSSADKTKLNGIATNANNYVHPTQHAPAIIAQDSNNRFVTDAEKALWNSSYASSAWTKVTMAAYWIDVSTPVYSLADGLYVYKDAVGVVFIKGQFQKLDNNAGQIVATLPAAYHPDSVVLLNCYVNAVSFEYLRINTLGQVQVVKLDGTVRGNDTDDVLVVVHNQSYRIMD